MRVLPCPARPKRTPELPLSLSLTLTLSSLALSRCCSSRARSAMGAAAELHGSRRFPGFEPLLPHSVCHHLRLFLLLRPVHLGQATDRWRAVAASTAAGELLLCVAPPPWATSRRAVATHGCAPACSCLPLHFPVAGEPPLAGTVSSDDPLCSNSHQGRCAEIQEKAGV
jgi:hypothetical protein